MKRVLAVAAVLSAAGLLPRSAYAEQKVAYVDVQRALEETDEGKRVIARLKGDFEKKQKELDSRQEELKKLKAELDKQQNILKPDALKAKQAELDQKVVQLQESYVRMQREVQEKQTGEQQRMGKKMQAVIAQIAQAEGFTFVLEKGVLLYGPQSLELTDEVIRKYNSTVGRAEK